MRIVHISNTFGRHEELDGLMPHGDVLVCTGNYSKGGKGAEDFLKWFSSRPHALKLLVRGPEDLIGKDANEPLPPSITPMENRFLQHKGIVFMGALAVNTFYHSCGELMQLAKTCTMRHGQVDVFLSHIAPAGILNGTQRGSEDLLRNIMRCKPAWHLFGHCPVGAGRREYMGMQFQNGALGDPRMQVPLRAPAVLDFAHVEEQSHWS